MILKAISPFNMIFLGQYEGPSGSIYTQAEYLRVLILQASLFTNIIY